MGRCWSRRCTAGCVAVLALSLTACGSGDPGSSDVTLEPAQDGVVASVPRSPTTIGDSEDPYHVLEVDWPTTLDEAALMLDRLPASLGGEERSPVLRSNEWFLVGNIPILASADESGRVLAGYADDEIERVVIAQPADWPAVLLGGFFVWGGAPEHCEDVEGSAALLDGDEINMDALESDDTAQLSVWLACTMQQNPDTGLDVEAPEDWAYGFGWTAPSFTYFVVARSVEQRDELITELIAAAASDAPPTDPNNPILTEAWWPGGVLLNCGYSDVGDGVIRSDPVTGVETLVVEASCDRASASPDGRELVFDDYDVAKPEMFHLVIADASGTNRRDLTPLTAGEVPADGDMDPTWSPTGEWIAFQRGGDQVYVVRPDGSDLHVVAEGRAPSWSSDGNMLLVRGDDGTAAVRLSDGSQVFEIPGTYSATWSPSDSVIAYERDSTLRMWSPDSGDLGAVENLDSLGGVWNPVWSPDGDFLLVYSEAYGPTVVDPVDGTAHRVDHLTTYNEYILSEWTKF